MGRGGQTGRASGVSGLLTKPKEPCFAYGLTVSDVRCSSVTDCCFATGVIKADHQDHRGGNAGSNITIDDVDL